MTRLLPIRRFMVRRFAVTVLGLLVTGCPAPKEASRPYPQPELITKGKPALTIGAVKMTDQELEKRMNEQSPFLRARLKDAEKRQDFVDQLVRFELLAQEAWSRKLYEDPAVIPEIKKIIVQRLLKVELDNKLNDIKVGPAELQAAYDERKEEFNKPETIRVAQIVKFGDLAAGRTALAEIKHKIEAAEATKERRAFAMFAREHSDHEGTKRAGGDLSFMDKAQLTESFGEDVANELFAGEVGTMVLTESKDKRSALLLKKTGRRRLVHRTLEQVKPQLRSQLLRKKRGQMLNDFITTLKSKHGFNLDEEAIRTLEVDLTGSDPGAAGGPGSPARP